MYEDATARVTTPAMMLMVTGALLLVVDILNILLSVFGFLSPIFQAVVAAMQIADGADPAEIAASVFQVAFGGIFGVVRLLFAVLGIAASVATILGGQRLMQLRSRNLVVGAAALASIQPIGWVVTGCFTSGCGLCAPLVYLPLALLGVVASIITFTALNEVELSADDVAAG